MPDVHTADGQVFPVKPEIAAKAHISAARYQDMFERAAVMWAFAAISGLTGNTWLSAAWTSGMNVFLPRSWGHRPASSGT